MSLDDFYNFSAETMSQSTTQSSAESTNTTSFSKTTIDTSHSFTTGSTDSGSTGPLISISTPVSNQNVGTSVLIEGTTSDEDGVAFVEVKIDANEYKYAFGTTSFSYIYNGLAYGEHIITVRATDGTGEVNLTTVTITSHDDSIKPIVQIQSPENNDWIAGDWLIEGVASDNVELAEVHISVDGDPWMAVEDLDTWSYNFTGLENGWHTIMVRATDILDNEAFDHVILRVENNPGSISIEQPNAMDTVGGLVMISGTASDNEESGIASVEVQIQAMGNPVDDLSWNMASGTEAWMYEWDSSAEPIQDYTAYVRCTDVVGNVSEPVSRNFHLGRWVQKGDYINTVESQYSRDPHLLVHNGVPYLAYREYIGSVYNIFVKTWDGSAWQPIGATLNINSGRDAKQPRIYFDPATDDLYCTWTEYSGSHWQIYLKKWDGMNWNAIGGSINENTGWDAYHPDVAICPDVSPYPIVVQSCNSTVYVRKWVSPNWITIGGNINPSGYYGYDPYIYFIGASVEPYVLYEDRSCCGWSTRVKVRKWDSSSWSLVHNLWGSGDTDVKSLDYQLDSNNLPFITFVITSGGWERAYAYHHDGSDWTTLGGTLNEYPDYNAYDTHIALDTTTNTPYITISQANPTLRWMYVKTWTGTDWETFGGEVLNTNFLHDCYTSSIFFDSNTGVPHVVFDQWDGSTRWLYYKHY